MEKNSFRNTDLELISECFGNIGVSIRSTEEYKCIIKNLTLQTKHFYKMIFPILYELFSTFNRPVPIYLCIFYISNSYPIDVHI